MSKVIAALLAACLSQPAGAAPSGKEIMSRNEEARKLDDVTSSAKLTTGGGKREEKVKGFAWWRKLAGDQVHFNTLTRFHSPAEVRGEGILFLEGKDGENEVLLYLPNFKKIRRVENQQQSGSFMGSEFSYSDIASPHVDEHEYQVLREEACPGPEAGGDPGAVGQKCWVIEATPASEQVRERTGYSRTLNWIRQDNHMGAKGEYYDLEGKLFKKLSVGETKLVDSAKKKWMSHLLRIENSRSGKYTVLKFADVKANTGVKDAIFTQQNLQRAN